MYGFRVPVLHRQFASDAGECESGAIRCRVGEVASGLRFHGAENIGRAPSPANAASGWRPSLLARSASVASSWVLSFTLLGERPLHFQLNRNNVRTVRLFGGCFRPFDRTPE